MKWSLDLKEDSMNPFYVKELLAKEAIIKARLYSVDPRFKFICSGILQFLFQIIGCSAKK